MQITIPTKFHAYHLENFRFDLQRFASVTITPNVALKNGSTIKVIFKGYYIDNNSAIFTYNAADKSFSETHSSPLSFRASIDNNNIVIKISVDSDFSDLYLIDTVTLDTANNKWIFAKGMYTSETSDYRFAFNDTTISYDSNNTFSSNFYDLIGDGYTITIAGKTYSVDFDSSGNLTSVNGTALALDNGKVTLDGKTYTFSGTTSSITYRQPAMNGQLTTELQNTAQTVPL